jgi:hypothetical protein
MSGQLGKEGIVFLQEMDKEIYQRLAAFFESERDILDAYGVLSFSMITNFLYRQLSVGVDRERTILNVGAVVSKSLETAENKFKEKQNEV